MGFDLQGLVPGLGGSLNIKALDTPLFGVAKRAYGQIQSYYDDKMNLKNTAALMAQRVTAANQPGEINDFMATIRNQGIAKPNAYAVLVMPPAGMASQYQEMFRTCSMLCETAAFPSINIMTNQFRTYGPFIEIPYIRANEPITLTFITDSKMRSRIMFDAWMDLIINPYTNNVSFYGDFVGSISIMQKSSETANTVYSVNLLNAYPKMVHEMPLSYGETGSYHKVSVQFVYEKMWNIEVDIPTPVSSDTVRSQMNKVSGIDKIKNAASDAIEGIQQTATQTVDNIKTKAGDMYSSIKDQFPRIDL